MKTEVKGYKIFCPICDFEHEFFPVSSEEGHVKLSAVCVNGDGKKARRNYYYDTRKGTLSKDRGGEAILRPKRKGIPTPRRLSRLEGKSGKYFDGGESAPLLTQELDYDWVVRPLTVLWQTKNKEVQHTRVTAKICGGLAVHRQLVESKGEYVFNKHKGLYAISHTSGFCVLSGGYGYHKEADAIKCAQYLLASGINWALSKEELSELTNAREIVSEVINGKVKGIEKPYYKG